MNKVCCVEDADISPKSSSCSMVLRSACSHHRHSRESSTVKQESRAHTPRKSKCVSNALTNNNSCNGTLHIESVLESSLKQLAFKSAERTYSLLKEGFYKSYEVSEDIDQKVFETNAVKCARELHFDYLSSSKPSSLGGCFNLKECSSDYSSASESDLNSSELLDSTSNMSRTRLTRSSVPSMRSLSGSEGEDGISFQGLRSRKSKSVNQSMSNLSGIGISSQDVNNHYISGNHIERHSDANNHFSRYSSTADSNSQSHLANSSHLDRSTVQFSAFDRFRWFLWRCTYMRIINCVNFDVWLLSRLFNYGKWFAIFFFILPLLMYLCWDSVEYNTSHKYEVLTEFPSTVLSSVRMFLSSIFSALYEFFVRKEEMVVTSDAEEIVVTSDVISDTSHTSESLFSSFGGFTVISAWLAKVGGSIFSSEIKSEPKINTYQSLDEEIQLIQPTREKIQLLEPSREEIRQLAIEVLRDEINFLKELHRSDYMATEFDKLEKERKLQHEMQNLKIEFESLSQTMEKLQKDISKQNENSEMKVNIITLNDHLNIKLKAIEAKLGVLEGLKSSCDKQWNQEDILSLLEKNLVIAFRNIIDGEYNHDSKYYFFNQWLNSKFYKNEKLIQEINAALKSQSSYQENAMNHDNVMQVVEATVVKYVESIKRNLTLNNSGYASFSKDIFSEDRVKKIVKEAIMLYNADKTGQVDYALESGGGSVVGTRCSETYTENSGKVSFFGLPLWTHSNSPRTAIQPGVQPGQCWAFKGSQGFLVLELSATVYPTGFTLEHIPVSLSRTGSVDSAPKNFSVWGLESEKDNKGDLLGKYWYDISGEPWQYFAVQKPSEKPYSYIELQIHSNHGNMEYTCLYRFRVHGKRVH